MKTDLTDLFDLCSSPDVFYYGGGASPLKDVEQAKDLLETWVNKSSAFAIVLNQTNRVIGNIGYEIVDYDQKFTDGPQIEFGFSIHPDHWNNGYVTEALMTMIEVLRSDSKKYCIWVSHYDYNPSSKRVIEKCGFEYSFSKDKRLKLIKDRDVEVLFYKLIV
jgi:RimJ/RimL family protein N-acetyltransferase